MISTEKLLDKLQAVINEARGKKKKVYGLYTTNHSTSVHLLGEDGNLRYSNGQYGRTLPLGVAAIFYHMDGVDAETRARDLRNELNSEEE